MIHQGNRLGGLVWGLPSMSCLSVPWEFRATDGDVLLASLGMFGGMEFLGEHEVTLLGPANKVFLDTVHSLVVHLPVS